MNHDCWLGLWFLFIVTILCLTRIFEIARVYEFVKYVKGLVTSENLIDPSFSLFGEGKGKRFGMCSYLLIGFWFTRPTAANACLAKGICN